MSKLVHHIESWERQNWILLYEIGFQFRKRLRQVFNLGLFIAYLILRRSFELGKALLYFGGLQDHRIQISPEVPSLYAREQNWSLHQKVGPSAFIR